MKNILLLSLVTGLLSLLTAPSLGQESVEKVISCIYGHKKPMTSGEAKITIRDKKIDKIAFNNYYPGMRGSLGYTCSIEVSRDNSAYSWQDIDTGARVSIKDAEDAFTLSRNKKGYLLSFKSINTLSRFCGAGAELPDDVLIPLSGKSCVAKIPK